MPHLTVFALESDLVGREMDLILGLTEAVAGVYGEWARPMVHVVVVGVAHGRWGVAGKTVATAGPVVQFGIRESAFHRDDADELIAGLVRALTDAVTAALGEWAASVTQIDLVAMPAGRSALGGRLVD